MLGFSRSIATAAGLVTALWWTAAPVQAAPEADPAATRTVGSEASHPGAFCTPSRCRPAKGSLWTTAAFGAVVLVIHRSARRETR